jgi:hypothetical protein
VLLCTGLVFADGLHSMRAMIVDRDGHALLQAKMTAYSDAVSEPIRGEQMADGCWFVSGLGEKAILVIKEPTRGSATVEMEMPADPGVVVQIIMHEKTAEARVIATLPDPDPVGLQQIPAIAPSPLGRGGLGPRDILDCPGDSLFAQPVHDPTDTWSAGTSEIDVSGSVLLRAESFTGGGEICDIHWWGFMLYLGTDWAPCTDSDPQFEIKFYDDAGGAPGTEVCSYLVYPTMTYTGFYYHSYYQFELILFSVDPLSPCCIMDEGWVSIQGLGDATCWFLWQSSGTGDGSSYFNNDGIPESYLYDNSLCLTGTYIPTYGACCDDSTGICTDNVEMQDCLPPLRFAENTLCADLDPACGDIVTCDHTIVLTDDYGDGWNGGMVDVLVNGMVVLDNLTLPSGSGPQTTVFQAATGDSISTVYVAGGWSYENEYHIYDVNGFEICADGVGGSTPTGGFCGYGNCGADPCEGNEPVNDECTDATPVSGPYPQTVSGSNYCATVDCPGVLDWYSTWFAIDLPYAANNLVIDFCGNGYEINHCGVVVLDDCANCAGYILYDGIDWYSCSDGITSPIITWEGLAGPATVYFPVMFNYGSTANYTIEINVSELIVPDNDLCEDAIAVAVPSTTPGTTQGAGVDSDAPYCVVSPTSPGVWYTVTGTGNTMTASLCNGVADWDTKLTVYCGTCDDLICVDGNDDSCGLQSEVTWCSQLLAEYIILVHGYGGANGPFELEIWDDGTPCTGAVKCLPEGACCLLTGECVIMPQPACEYMGGDYHGDDTTCGITAEQEESRDCNYTIIDSLTSSSPIWDRIYGAYTPDVNCNATVYDSGSNGQYYAVYPITVATTENLEIEVLSADFDTIMALYCDPFDPANPMDNVVAYDDDGAGYPLSAFWTTDNITLPAGVTYYLVLSSFSGGYTGDYEVCLRGTATVGGGGPGACCLPDGTCEDMEAADCSAAGGFFGGSGSECATYVCPEYPGACCLADGSCIVTIESCCDYAGGVFVGEGTDCGTGWMPIFTEDFNAGIPGDWTIIDDDGGGLIWGTTSDNNTGGTGLCAEASSDDFGSSSYDTSLITPNIDLSAAISATLDCDANFQNYAYYDWFYIDVSYDKGVTWNNLLTWNEDHGGFSSPPGEHITVPLAGGNMDCLVRFRYYDPVTHWNWWVQVDDVIITAEVEGLSPCQDMDIKPGSCPNSFNRTNNGVLPVALVGTADFDAYMVDTSTLLLSRVDGVGGSLAPHEGPPGPKTVIEDVASPFDGTPCDCHELEGDGIMDVSMKFKSVDVVSVLELDGESPGALIDLVVSGYMYDGTPFIGRDCIRLVPPGTPPALLMVSSNQNGAWIDVSPLDSTLDGGGFCNFERVFPVGSVVTLSAPPEFQGRSFIVWKVNGVQQSRQSSLDITITEGIQEVSIEAMYLNITPDDTVIRPSGQKKSMGTVPLP